MLKVDSSQLIYWKLLTYAIHWEHLLKEKNVEPVKHKIKLLKDSLEDKACSVLQSSRLMAHKNPFQFIFFKIKKINIFWFYEK